MTQLNFEFIDAGSFLCPERNNVPLGIRPKEQDHWRGPFPHTCSFCGGLRPDDAIALIKDGGTLDGTTKGYKHYIHHPEHRGANKLYSWHVTIEDAKNINKAIKEYKENNPF